MSTATLSGPVAADASAAMARVSQLQQLIEQAGQISTLPASTAATAAGSSSPDFASVLSSASAATATTSASAADSSSAELAGDLTSAPTTTAPSGFGAYASDITAAAASYGIDPSLLYGVISQESAFNPNAVSSAGAEGIAQIMPENFASLGVTNPFDPVQSINAGAKLLSENLQTFNGNTVDAIAAYNAGSAAVEQYGGIPPYAQTQNYVQRVLAYAAAYPGAGTTDSTTGLPAAGTPGVTNVPATPTDAIGAAAADGALS
jgi:soluble lytic murein transglycosylase-like protein